ncbi:MAG TPA: cytochrome c biogenesis protein CcdA [Candidatus Limnocylindrales bacterium]|nr:cytochrome c biogenesis protein CcdA [Candidatus Limnocylindrales bacterium]
MALKAEYEGVVEVIIADLDNPQTEKLLEKFTVFYIPAFYFINAQGEIVAEEAGILSLEKMREQTEVIKGEVVAEEMSRLEYFFSVTMPEAVAQRSFLTLALVLLGGLLTSVSPCILAMVPVLVSYIGGHGGGTKSRGFFLSLSFVTGLAVTFAVLGFIAAFFGRIFGQIGGAWYYILAAVAIIMGLQLLGILTFDLPGLKRIPVKKEGLIGAFLMGMLFGLVASPCATPVLAVVITYAAVQAEPFYGSGLLFIYGLGHGIPLLIAGTFTGMVRNLPKLSRYTHYLSYISGLVLVIVGLILLLWARW